MSLSRKQQARGNAPGRKKSGVRLDCALGHPCYATKVEAQQANPSAKVLRCARCRHWRAK